MQRTTLVGDDSEIRRYVTLHAQMRCVITGFPISGGCPIKHKKGSASSMRVYPKSDGQPRELSFQGHDVVDVDHHQKGNLAMFQTVYQGK